METKRNVAEKAIAHHRRKNKIDVIKETENLQASQSKKYKSIINEPNKGISLEKSISLDKSRASKITEIEDTVKTINK